MIPETVIYSATIVLAVTFGVDFIVTIFQLCKLNEKLKELQAAMDQKIYGSEAMKKLENAVTPRLNRFAKAFPRMHSTVYDGALQKILEKIRSSHHPKEKKSENQDADPSHGEEALTHKK